MKKFIRYLYEYQNGKKIRNVGFVRMEESDDSAVIQIYGQGFPAAGNQTLEIFLFYLQGNQVVGIAMGEIPGTRPVFGYRLRYTAEDVEGQEIYRQLKGLIIRTNGNRHQEWYAAMWDEQQINIEEMLSREEISKKHDNFMPTNYAEPSAEAEPPVEMEPPIETEPPAEMESPAETEASVETEQSQQEETISELSDQNPIFQEQIFKITRQNLVQLPRREWRLANNHFLLHGYHNYHHLVSFRKDGRCWLGVPGIYHPREERVAGAFGFRQFMKPEEGEIELTEEERNAGDDFGYWCCEISNVVKTRREEDEKETN